MPGPVSDSNLLSRRPPSPWMKRALAAAREARGRTGSNPWVGAVLVRQGALLSEGATGEPGEPHAEAAALAGVDASGATLYVTLEPCVSFAGKRTPACATQIIEAGVERVVVAIPDPDPRVSGRGMEALRRAGITVEVGDGYGQTLSLLRPYVKHRETGRPYVIAKFAASLDGRAATNGGESKWITGAAARERVHAERSRTDAILVGSGTVMADDPQLTARPGGVLSERQPLRVVFDGRGRTLPDARLFRAPGGVLVATSPHSDPRWRKAIEEAGAEILLCSPGPPKVPLDQVLGTLGRRGVVTAWVEGGGHLLGSLFEGRHVDEVWAFVAPMIIGGDGRPAVGAAGVHRLTAAWRLRETALEQLGDDLLIRGFLSTIDGPVLTGRPAVPENPLPGG